MKKRIIVVISSVIGAALSASAMEVKRVKDIEKKRQLSDKHLRLFKTMNQWLHIRQEGKSLEDYFRRNGYKKVIIYGMHYAGERLVEELKDTDITIVCGIDKNAQSIFEGIAVITKEDEIPDADVIVVTAISYYDEIEEELKHKIDFPIVSLEDILYEI